MFFFKLNLFFGFKESYRRKLEEKLSLDSRGNPFRMLVFRGSPKSSRRSIRCVDEMRRDEAGELENSTKQYKIRSLPKVVFCSDRYQTSFTSIGLFVTKTCFILFVCADRSPDSRRAENQERLLHEHHGLGEEQRPRCRPQLGIVPLELGDPECREAF